MPENTVSTYRERPEYASVRVATERLVAALGAETLVTRLREAISAILATPRPLHEMERDLAGIYDIWVADARDALYDRGAEAHQALRQLADILSQPRS